MLLNKRLFTAFGSLFTLVLFLTSCGSGYQWGNGGAFSSYSTISIPYVEGDWNGDLTAALIKAMSQSGVLTYRPQGGALILKVTLIDERYDDVGFRYERTRHGRVRKSVVPDETRVMTTADVVLVDTCSGQILLGPARLTAEVEFDHFYYSTRSDANVFSLGQVTDYDEACDVAEYPLNRRLAQKIVDYVNDNW